MDKIEFWVIMDAMEKNKIKVLLSYINYPLAMGTYFKKALQHRKDVDLKVTGIYTGAWIPWQGGLTLPNKYALPPDIPLPFTPHVNECNYEIIKAQLGDWKPDLIIQVDAGFHFRYKPVDGMVVTVGTDPHVLNDWYDAPRSYSDKFFNMQKVYSKPNDIYLPYAYSKYDCYPEDIPNPDDAVDAVLIGMPYDNRIQWVNKLRERGVSVIFENGPVFDEARALYNRGRIGLNHSSLQDLNCRWFELPAMKLCAVMNNVPDAHLFMEKGIDYLEFSTIPEAIECVIWAKNNPDQAKHIAQNGYKKIMPHTFDSRVEQILRECNFL